MTANEKRLSKALTRLIAEIEEMSTRKIDNDGQMTYFGPFSESTSLGESGEIVSWPNLRILVEELKPLTDEFDVVEGDGGPPYDAATKTGMYDPEGG